jgi:hypothetical protein
VNGIVALGQIPIDLDQPEPDDLEAALFETGKDAAGQLALNAVWLDEYESSLSH